MALAMAPAQTATELTHTRNPVPSSYFAMNILFHPLNHVPWPAVPLGGWRTSHASWADIEPERGRWHFELLDKYVDWSEEHRLDILMPLTYTPRWASSAPDAPTDVANDNPPGLSGPPRDMDDWRNFVRTVATRYKGRIRNWEIWNEPNRPQSWTGSVSQMIDMTREAYTILSQIDPSSTVVSPAATETYGLKFFEAFIGGGGGRYADAIGYHFYVGRDDPPEAAIGLIDSVKKILEKNGLATKPIWNTEAGWLGPTLLPPDTGVAWLTRAYILNWAAGVSRFYWYAWENHHGTRIELVGPDNAALTPAGKALSTLETWMTGAIVDRCAGAASGIWTCDLERTGRRFHIVWNSEGDAPKIPVEMKVPIEWRASHATSLDGAGRKIAGTTVSIGIAPLLIE